MVWQYRKKFSTQERYMTEEYDNDEYQSKIYAHLKEKDTDELLKIWKENNRSEWTEEAFDAIWSILSDRLGEVPEQGEPRDEYDDQVDEQEAEEQAAEGGYPTERKLIWIAELARNVSWVNVGVAVVYALYRLFAGFSNPQPIGGEVSLGLMQSFGILFPIVDSLVFAAVIFVLLQAVAEIIYLIMDIRELVEPEETEPAGLSDPDAPARNG
jgi:hypothetical protein